MVAFKRDTGTCPFPMEEQPTGCAMRERAAEAAEKECLRRRDGLLEDPAIPFNEEKGGKKKTRRRSRRQTNHHQHEKGNRLMTPATIPQEWQESKVYQQMDLGVRQEVLLPSMMEELLETSQRGEERERILHRAVMISWLIGMHVSPHVSQRAVYATLVRGLRASCDAVPHEIPATLAFRYRREPLGSERVEERVRPCAGPKATAETPGAFWRVVALDGQVGSVPPRPSLSCTTDCLCWPRVGPRDMKPLEKQGGSRYTEKGGPSSVDMERVRECL
jgi:hypothetical protein